MGRQHNKPYIVINDAAHALQPVEDLFKETWLQDFIFKHSESLPIAEIEPVFGPLIPVCRELRTKAGPIDNLFINKMGLLTLVECKLWKNPEARREVVGQILDYAKEISSWSYDDLERAVRAATQKAGSSLCGIVSQHSEELDEIDFVDSVSRNLRRGRFLLLVVGTGIRESVELIADFLQRHAHLNFSLALVETGMFQLPEELGKGYLVLPRVVAQTIEIERAVIRIEDGKVIAEMSAEEATQLPSRTKISEQVFYETLARVDKSTARGLGAFLEEAKKMGLYVEPGENSLKLKFISDDDVELNFGVFMTDGTFRNFMIAKLTNRIGHPEIGEAYLTKLASLIKDGYVHKPPGNLFRWTVKKGNNQNVSISECLAVRDKWLAIVEHTISELVKAQEKE